MPYVQCCYYCKNVFRCPKRCPNDLYRCQFCAWHVEEPCKDFEEVKYEEIEELVKKVFGRFFEELKKNKMEEAVEILYYDIVRTILP
ncbi:hypothetical protein [Methanocaldococcus fervens]|uniref:Uncharacterized protein n=1 Tax=Methanocaldococcus fervens (strain DSM 4213 / JCM 15782 / AG86) TaxID=573064 RepID=C7P9Q1_METFA|nr:hypothetical protein [Methanocaldococcus fervens]ACV25408.1 hypothetical protein Mefer_1605 [Methanocaldococcus fervens AG86]